MPLRPPSFRFVLALVGAVLILTGAKGDVLDMPMIGVVSLFNMYQTAAYVLVAAGVAVVALSWFRPAAPAWVAWLIAVGAVAFVINELYSSLKLLEESFQAARAEGLPAPDLSQIVKSTKIKPGAVSLLSGLVIQVVGLLLNRRK